MFDFVAKHEFWVAVGAYWVFSAAVSALPTPSSNAQAAYLWMYRFLHTLAGNVTTVFGSRIPGASTIAAVLVAVLLCSSGCAAHYAVHPASLSAGDSAAYDTLLIAQAMIDQARSALQAGQLPVSTKDTLNTLIHSYNVARASWLSYRDALAANVPSDTYLNQLTLNLTDLTNAIRAFQQKGPQ